MTKSQGRRRNKLKGYYERQFEKTKVNKARREKRRARQRAEAEARRKLNEKPTH
jgi:hypothetical protein